MSMKDHENTEYKGSKNPFVAWVNADPAPERKPKKEKKQKTAGSEKKAAASSKDEYAAY